MIERQPVGNPGIWLQRLRRIVTAAMPLLFGILAFPIERLLGISKMTHDVRSQARVLPDWLRCAVASSILAILEVTGYALASLTRTTAVTYHGPQVDPWIMAIAKYVAPPGYFYVGYLVVDWIRWRGRTEVDPRWKRILVFSLPLPVAAAIVLFVRELYRI